MSDDNDYSPVTPSEDFIAAQTRSIRVIRDAVMPHPDTPLMKCPTNLDLTTKHGRAMLFNAAGPGDEAIPEGATLKMLVTHWVIHPDRSTDEQTGELKEFTRTVLIGKDGRTFRTTAAYLPQKIWEAMQLFTEAEWREGITFEVRERKSRREKRVYHDIRISIEPQP